MPASDSATTKRVPLLLWIIVFFQVFIGIAMVIRRTLIISGVIASVNPLPGPPIDGEFSRHPLMTLLHILPGILFMILGPFQFMKTLRARHIRFHRWSGRIFIGAAYIIGVSALTMPFVMIPIGGLNEAAASILFAIFFLISISLSLKHILNKNQALHREWMLRAFAIGLAVATVRPIVGFFFAFSGLPSQVFFGTAFWIGFTMHLITAEVWINYTRPRLVTNW